MGETAGPPQITDMQRSSRDAKQLRSRLEAWFAQMLPAGSSPTVPALDAATSANGMSSETGLLTPARTEGGGHRGGQLLARGGPDPPHLPVFARDELQRQVDV